MNARDTLDALLRPRSIAVIGVSRTIARQATVGGAAVVNNLRKFGYGGRLYVIHPEAAEIAGVPAYPSIAALPETPDMVSVAVPAAALPPLVAACGERGVKAMTIHSAGFAELGTNEGIAHERALRESATAFGIRICGPNGLGYINVPDKTFAGSFPSLETVVPRSGGLAILTQSGAVGGSLIARAADRAAGLSFVISNGNETTVSLADYIDFLVRDPRTSAIAIYLEGVADGPAFVRALAAARAARKPIVVYKVGKSEAGAKAALSHTAKVAGSAVLFSGLFRQFGVVEAEALDDLIDIPALLIKTASNRFAGPPRRAGIVTISGGLGAITTDHLAAKGIAVPPFADATQDRLRAMAIPFASTANPVDTTAAIHHNEAGMAEVLEIVADDPGIDLIIAPNASRFPQAALQTARRLDAIGATLAKPLVSIWYAGQDNGEAIALLRASDSVASFDDHASCARALAALELVVAADLRAVGEPEPDRQPEPRLPFEPSGVLSEADSKAILHALGVPLARERHVHGADAAARAAAEIVFPVALKIVSPDIAHKAAVGGVRLKLNSAGDVREAYDAIMRDAGSAAPSARLDGVVVSEMVPIAAELLVGTYTDATFGRALVVGVGGSLVEEIKDVAIALLPASRRDCAAMLERMHDRSLKTRIRPHLAAVVESIARIAAMAAALPGLVEMDINPLALTAHGNVVALDAVMKFSGTDRAPDRRQNFGTRS